MSNIHLTIAVTMLGLSQVIHLISHLIKDNKK
jgi:hypothetical protein